MTINAQNIAESLEKYKEHQDKQRLEKELSLGQNLWENSTKIDLLYFLYRKLKENEGSLAYHKFFNEELTELAKKYPQSKINGNTTEVLSFDLDVGPAEMLRIFDLKGTYQYPQENIDLYINSKLVFSGTIFYEVTGGRDNERWDYKNATFETFEPGDWLVSLYKQFEVFAELYKQKSEENEEYHTQVLNERIQRKLKEKGIRK